MIFLWKSYKLLLENHIQNFKMMQILIDTPNCKIQMLRNAKNVWQIPWKFLALNEERIITSFSMCISPEYLFLCFIKITLKLYSHLIVIFDLRLFLVNLNTSIFFEFQPFFISNILGNLITQSRFHKKVVLLKSKNRR